MFPNVFSPPGGYYNAYHPRIKYTEEVHQRVKSKLLKQKRLHRCNLCGEPADLRCSLCKIVYYCNKDCQKNDWKFQHKHDCIRLDLSFIRAEPFDSNRAGFSPLYDPLCLDTVMITYKEKIITHLVLGYVRQYCNSINNFEANICKIISKYCGIPFIPNMLQVDKQALPWPTVLLNVKTGFNEYHTESDHLQVILDKLTFDDNVNYNHAQRRYRIKIKQFGSKSCTRDHETHSLQFGMFHIKKEHFTSFSQLCLDCAAFQIAQGPQRDDGEDNGFMTLCDVDYFESCHLSIDENKETFPFHDNDNSLEITVNNVPNYEKYGDENYNVVTIATKKRTTKHRYSSNFLNKNDSIDIVIDWCKPEKKYQLSFVLNEKKLIGEDKNEQFWKNGKFEIDDARHCFPAFSFSSGRSNMLHSHWVFEIQRLK